MPAWVKSFLVATFAVGVVVLIRLLMSDVLGTRFLLAGMIAPVALAVWVGGVWWGIYAVVLGYLAARVFFPFSAAADVVLDVALGFAFYVVPCGIIIAFGESRRRLVRQLQARASLSEESGQRKTEFIATLSHELRTPIGAPTTDIHLLGMAGTEAVRAPALARMQRQAAELKRLVDDLLDVSRIGQGKVDLQFSRVALDDLLRFCAEALRPLHKGHYLRLELPAQPVAVRADATRITQVVNNLMTNACKFSPQGSPVTLSLAADERTATLTVRDQGMGIPHDKLEAIFGMFTQLKAPGTRESSGLGIGLCLARQLIELHGGTVVARSDGAGKGSEFVIVLPLAR